MVPSAGVTQMLLPLKNIHEQYQITRIVVSDYTSTSVYGKEGMDELFNQTRKIFMNDTLVDDQQVFHKQVAFNVIPQVGDFQGTKLSLNGHLMPKPNKSWDRMSEYMPIVRLFPPLSAAGNM